MIDVVHGDCFGMERIGQRFDDGIAALRFKHIAAADVAHARIFGHQILEFGEIGGVDAAAIRVLQTLDQFQIFERQRHRFSSSVRRAGMPAKSEEHTSELQSLMRISYAVFCLKKKKKRIKQKQTDSINI